MPFNLPYMYVRNELMLTNKMVTYSLSTTDCTYFFSVAIRQQRFLRFGMRSFSSLYSNKQTDMITYRLSRTPVQSAPAMSVAIYESL